MPQRWGIQLLVCAEAWHEQQGWRAASGHASLLALLRCCSYCCGCIDEATRPRPALRHPTLTGGPRQAHAVLCAGACMQVPCSGTLPALSYQPQSPLSPHHEQVRGPHPAVYAPCGELQVSVLPAHRVPCGAHRPPIGGCGGTASMLPAPDGLWGCVSVRPAGHPPALASERSHGGLHAPCTGVIMHGGALSA